MKVLMTGSTGLVGSRLVELLAPMHEIVELREEDGFDIVDLECVQQRLDVGADAMVHLAAYTDVSAANRGGDCICYRVNSLGTRNIARTCAERGIFLVHFSTDFVFDGHQRRPYTEEDLPNPIEWYGQTKLWAEEEVLASGCRAAILRIAFPFRARFDGKFDLVRWILKGLEERTLPPMVSDQWITPTFIDDLAPVVAFLTRGLDTGVFHTVGSSITTPYYLARRVAAFWGFDPDVVRQGHLEDLLRSDPRPRQKDLALSNWKLRRMGLVMSDLDAALRMVKVQMQGGGR